MLGRAKAVFPYQRPAPGTGVCIITNGGGSGVLAADECARRGLELPAFPKSPRELREAFPSFYTVAIPST
jgi:acyl-CoA synthetase (NDP forming)